MVDFIRVNPVMAGWDAQQRRDAFATDQALRQAQTSEALEQLRQRRLDNDAMTQAFSGGQGAPGPAASGDATETMIGQMQWLLAHPGVSAQRRMDLMHAVATLQTQQANRQQRTDTQADRNRYWQSLDADRADRRSQAQQNHEDNMARLRAEDVERARQRELNINYRVEQLFPNARAVAPHNLTDDQVRDAIRQRLRQLDGQQPAQGGPAPAAGGTQPPASAAPTAPTPNALAGTPQPRWVPLPPRPPAAPSPPAGAPTTGQRSDAGGRPDGDAVGGAGSDVASDFGDGMGGGDRAQVPGQMAQPPQAGAPSAASGSALYSPRYIDTLVAQEGTGANPRSSAAGVGQFLRGTWIGRPDAPGIAARLPGVPRELLQAAWANNPQAVQQLLAMRNDPAVARAGIAEYARQVADYMRAHGVQGVDDTRLALAHFLGPAGATRFLGALAQDPNQQISRVVPPAVMQANPNLTENGQPITLGRLMDIYQQRYGRQAPAPDAPPDRSVTRAPLPPVRGVPSTMPGREGSFAGVQVPLPPMPPAQSSAPTDAGAPAAQPPGAIGMLRTPQAAAATERDPLAPPDPQAAAAARQFSPAEADLLRETARQRIQNDPTQRDRIVNGLQGAGVSVDGL
jgi:hypothetical protein